MTILATASQGDGRANTAPEPLTLFGAFDLPRGAGCHEPAPREIAMAGRRRRPTCVFDTYWRFAAARQRAYEARQTQAIGPWTDDPILRRHRFTNCFRAADRVSQYLIRHVSYSGSQEPEEIAFRTLLFKMFNRISTWELLVDNVGEPSWKEYSFKRYNEILGKAFGRGIRLYSPAYVVPHNSTG
jgi:hypothetical protein